MRRARRRPAGHPVGNKHSGDDGQGERHADEKRHGENAGDDHHGRQRSPLQPARVRGWTDLSINGSFWVGVALGALASVVLLDPSRFAPDIGWRLAFLMGAGLAVCIFVLRLWIPESPRWLMTHQREAQARAIVDDIEARFGDQTADALHEQNVHPPQLPDQSSKISRLWVSGARRTPTRAVRPATAMGYQRPK